MIQHATRSVSLRPTEKKNVFKYDRFHYVHKFYKKLQLQHLYFRIAPFI